METRRLAALAGIVGPSLFVLVFLFEGATRPGYSPVADYVSALSLGDRGWIQIANFLLVGACLLALTTAVAGEFPRGAASRAGPILLGLIGFGYLLSGPFVMDPAGTPATAMSAHGIVHGVLGAIVFVLMPLVCFVFLRRFGREPAWRWFWGPTLALGGFAAVADVVFTAATKSPNLVAVTMPWAGLLQRLVIVPFMLWVIVFAAGLLRRRSTPAA